MGVGTVISGKIATGTLRRGMSVRAEGNYEFAGTSDSLASKREKNVGSITGPSFRMKQPADSFWIDPVESNLVEEVRPGMIVGF